MTSVTIGALPRGLKKCRRKDKNKTMVINETLSAIAQYRLMEEEAKKLREALEAEIKEYMIANALTELVGNEHKATYTEIISNRFDSTAFKRDHADLYEAYKKQSSTMRFTFA